MKDVGFFVDFRGAAILHITGNTKDVFFVEYYDLDTGVLEYSNSMSAGQWCRSEKKYFVNWNIVVKDLMGNVVFEEKIDLSGKDVVIDINNPALGDTIAWIPYLDIFRKKHNCNLTVHSVVDDIFKETYPDINWQPIVHKFPDEFDCYAYYLVYIGIDRDVHKAGIEKLNSYFRRNVPIKYISDLTFHDKRYHKEHPFFTPLQKVMTNYFGLDYKEIRPTIPQYKSERPIKKKYVCISEFASSDGMKLWNNQIGWKTVIKELKYLGYEVVSISKEKSKLSDVIKRNGDYPLTDRVWYLQHCEFFIGLGSGLSWLAWASGVKVVLIAGHSEKWVEFSENCIRIINEDVCHGCYNNPEHADKFCCYHLTLCPENKNFICTRAISPKLVLDKMKENNLI